MSRKLNSQVGNKLLPTCRMRSFYLAWVPSIPAQLGGN